MLKDKTGKEFKSGNYVVYATMEGQRCTLRYGVVVSADPLIVAGYNEFYKKLQKPSRIYRLDNVVILEKQEIPEEVLIVLKSKGE